MQNRSKWSAALPWVIGGIILVGSGLAVAERGDRAGQGRHDRMERWDSNGDGMITRAEAQAVMAERRAGLDANQDGEVSFEEFNAHRERRREEHGRDRFARLDRNGDGKVGIDELPDRTERMFTHVDADGDGQITVEELAQAKSERRGRHGRRHGRDGDAG